MWFTESQLDALAELANVASGTAATALSQMLGREIGLSVPRALALGLADAVDAAGDPTATVTGVAIPLHGDISGVVLLLIDGSGAEVLCSLLGVEAGTEVGQSAVCEIGNILGASYLNALGSMTGRELLPGPPHAATDLLSAIVSSVLAQSAGGDDLALMMESELDVAGESCAISFLLVPEADGVNELLAPLGLAPAS